MEYLTKKNLDENIHIILGVLIVILVILFIIDSYSKPLPSSMYPFKGLLDKQISKDQFEMLKKNYDNYAIKFLTKMNNVGKGLTMIFKGLFVDEMKGLGKGLNLGFKNTGELLFWASEYFFTHFLCMIQFFQNLHKCFLYYTLDTTGKIFYSPILFINYIAWEFFGKDLETDQSKVWDSIYAIDKQFHNTYGFHFAHYSKDIIDTCYSCKRLRVLALKSKASQIKYDFETQLPQLLQAGVQEMINGANLISSQ
jgi:hypothetical protein